MGNSASNNQHHELPIPPPSRDRTPHQPPRLTHSARAGIANHSEDWIDHREEQARRENSDNFGYLPGVGHLPGGYFETLSETTSTPPQQRANHTSASTSNSTSYQELSSDDDDEDTSTAAMAPTTRHRRNNSIVDLTESSPPNNTSLANNASPDSRRPRKRRAADDGEPGRSTKRRSNAAATATATATANSPATPQSPIDELDLTADEALLQSEQQKAIAAQQQSAEEASGPLKIGKRTCIICMEPYTNATVTTCGHIYCHECLTQALKMGERANDRRGAGNCPVCRKPVKRTGKSVQIVPVAFMKKSAFKGKGRSGG
jgi:hypothetical protein